MAHNETTTTEATLNDLRGEIGSVGFRVRTNNEDVTVYPDAPGAEFGVVEHQFEGLPARGVVLYDVVGYEIVDMDFEVEDRHETMQEEFEYYEAEIREYIEGVLFDRILPNAEGNVYREGRHSYVVENPWEGDRWTIELETENKRRVR